MLSSKGKLTDTEVIGQSSAAQIDWEKGRDRQQIFHLINDLLELALTATR